MRVDVPARGRFSENDVERWIIVGDIFANITYHIFLFALAPELTA